MATYHLLKEVPTNLRVNKKGKMYCADGQHLETYLKEKLQNYPESTPFAIVPSETLKRLNDMAWLVPHLCLAS